jgi:hypothetical protein
MTTAAARSTAPSAEARCQGSANHMAHILSQLHRAGGRFAAIQARA